MEPLIRICEVLHCNKSHLHLNSMMILPLLPFTGTQMTAKKFWLKQRVNPGSEPGSKQSQFAER
jgi:hypothetical protein